MTKDDFRRSQDLFRSAGFIVAESVSDEGAFGSWAIELAGEGLPKQRVVWDGRDGWLIVSAWATSGSWMNKWIGHTTSEQTPEAALSQLKVPVTLAWEEEVEREREEYWRKFQLEQALSSAGRLWEAGCYSDYVRVITPFQDQLSPAQLKRLAIAEKRAAPASAAVGRTRTS